MSSIYWNDESYDQLDELLDTHTTSTGRANIMAYVEDYAEENYPDPDEEQSVIDALDNLLLPQTAEEWVSTLIDGGLELLEGAAQSLPDVLSDPSLANDAKAIAKSLAGIAFAANLYFTVEAVNDVALPEQNAELAKAYTGVGVGIVTTGLFTALATDGLFAAIPFAATPIGAAAIGVLGGYASWKLMDYYWDDIIAGNVETVQDIADFLGDVSADIGDVLDDMFDDENFLDDLPAFVDGLVEPVKGLIPDQLPDWIDAPLGLFDGAKNVASPLVLDLDSDGIELTAFNAATTTTFFDLDGDGFAQQTAWVNNDDGLLVRDLNANGKIDDVDELFGSPTVDGFAKLALLDDNGDLIINQYDDAWGTLRVWQDANDDAVTQSGELLTLGSLNIVSIDLAGVAPSTSTINGNAISHTSTFRYANGSTNDIVDAWFVNDRVNSFYTGDYTLDVRAMFLPTLRGFGEMPDLHIAMSQNEDLLDLVEAFTLAWDFSAWGVSTDFDNDLADILYEWAGVQDETPTVYYDTLDSRKLDFLEKFFGESWHPTVAAPWGETSAATLLESWQGVFGILKASFLVQVGAASLFANPVTYDPFTGTITGDFDLSQTAVEDLVDFATAGGVDAEEYWLEVARFLDATVGLDNLTATEEDWLDDAVFDSDNSLTWQEIKDILDFEPGINQIFGTSGDDTLSGTAGIDYFIGSAGNDTLSGGSGDDIIEGGDGTDTLYGEAGNDELTGGDGNDTFDGGIGDDTGIGGSGDNTYIYTSGRDLYYDSSTSTDKIMLPSGIASGNLTIYRGNEDSLFITVGSLGDIEIDEFFSSTANRIETIQFSDTSTLDLTALTTLNFYGTNGADTLIGENGIDETIYGYAGNDLIWGRSGNDTIDGGDGNDELQGLDGNDTYIFSAGFDQITSESSGDETIIIPDGFAVEDLAFVRDGNNLIISVAGLGQMKIHGQLNSNKIEQLYFEEDDSTVEMSDVVVETRGGDGNDSLNGITAGASTNDILNGMGGNDTLNGDTGNDTFVFSEGDDTVNETSGTDQILFWEGWTPGGITISARDAGGGGWNDMLLEDANGNSLTVIDQFTTSSGTRVETVKFSDDTTWTIANMTIDALGTSGADNMGVSVAGLRMFGLAGNDNLGGHSGADYLHGGDGDDYMHGWAGDDLFVYSAGLDTVQDSDGADTLWLTGGITVNDISFSDYSLNDTKITITGGVDEVIVKELRWGSGGPHIETIKFDDGFYADLPSYNSWMKGTSGNDTVSGNSSANVLIGYAGDDTITGDAAADNAHGGDGADTIDGGTGADLLYGGAGNDSIKGGTGADEMDGGDGTDTVDYSADGAAVTVNLATGTATDGNGDTDTLRNFENVTGSGHGDTLTGSSSANTLDGGTGNDTLKGGAGDDSLTGGIGTDTADYSSATGAVTVDLDLGTASGEGSDTLSGIENVIGSNQGDLIRGSTSQNDLRGGAGDDQIFGLSANDALYGEDGNDLLQGNLGADTIDGGDGTDTVGYGFNVTGVIVDISNPASGSATGDGTDTLISIENVSGSQGNDTITGSSGVNVLNGAAGNDTIIGGGGADIMDGGANDDTFNLANGDFASGESITGGSGTADAIVLTNAATVDFTTGSLATLESLTGSSSNDTVTMAASHFAGLFTAIDLAGGSGDRLNVAVSGTVDISAATAATVSNTENGYLIGSGSADTLTITGSQLNGILAGTGTVDMGGGTDTLNLTATSSDLNTLGSTDASIANLEAISAAGAGAGVTITLSSQTEGFTLTGSSNADTLTGGAGNDTLKGGLGNDSLTGGSGTDTIDYSGATGAATIDLDAGTATGEGSDTLSGIENVIGSGYDDLIRGSTSQNDLRGGNGNDQIFGLSANDALYGEGGDDLLHGNLGADTIDGGDGTDTVGYGFALAGVTVDISDPNNGSATGDGSDTLISIENVNGSSFADIITGSSGANVLSGSGGNDTLYGRDGLDTLTGGNGNDTFMFENASAFNNVDVVTDFNITTYEDVLDISDILDATAYNHGVDTLSDWVQIATSGSDSLVSIDRDGTGGTYSMTQIATLQGINTSLSELVSGNNLVVV